MTTLTRFVPFRSPLADVAVLQNRLNSIFQDFARPDGEQEALAMGTSFLRWMSMRMASSWC
jgi:HSP20 family protein